MRLREHLGFALTFTGLITMIIIWLIFDGDGHSAPEWARWVMLISYLAIPFGVCWALQVSNKKTKNFNKRDAK